MYKTTTECKGEQYYASHQATDQDLQWSRMFRSDVTVILYRKTWFWRVCDRTKPTIYAGSMLLSKYLSLVLCVYTELFCKRAAFQNCCASAIPLSQVCWHPSCCTGMSLTGVRTHSESTTPDHKPETFHTHDNQWDIHLLRAKLGLNLCLYLLPDALPVMATWLTGILDIGNNLQESVEHEFFSYSMEKYSLSWKWGISSRTALLSIPHISNCSDCGMGKRAHTFPVDLTPFQMQKKHITQTRRRHSARSHLIIPISSIPEDKLSTLRLNIWKETKQERDAGAQLMQTGCDGWEYTMVCRADDAQISALKTLAKSTLGLSDQSCALQL